MLAWVQVASSVFERTQGAAARRADTSGYELMWHCSNGAHVLVKVNKPDNVFGVPVGQRLLARVISLDGVCGLLLFPPKAEGRLYSPVKVRAAPLVGFGRYHV